MTDPERDSKVSIESQGQAFAQKLRQRISAGQEKKYPYVPLRYQDVLKLPRLVTGELEFPKRGPFEEDLRFNPVTGAIYTTRWLRLETFLDTGPEFPTRSVVQPENYTFIYPDLKFPDPEELPLTGKPIGLVVSEVWDGLEPAIRQQLHILEGYEPASVTAEPQALRRIFYWINQTSLRFRDVPMTTERLEKLSQEAAELIDQAGLTSAIDETRKKLALVLVKSTTRDSLGRINPMVSRIRLRSAFLAVTRRIITAELVRRKFSANLEVLVAEREFIRFSLEQATTELGAILTVLRQPRSEIPRISGLERQELINKIRDTAQDYLAFPRVAPYLIPSRLAAIFLVGCRENKKELNRQVLGEEVAEEMFSIRPATSLLREGNIQQAERRVSWARSILDQVVSENRSISAPAEALNP